MSSCTPVAFNLSTESVESLNGIEPRRVLALHGTSRCAAQTAAGLASSKGACADLGVGDDSRWRQLFFLPQSLGTADDGARARASRLQAILDELQHGGPGCANRPTYTVAELPMIGTMATIEYGMLSMALSASSGSRLILGRGSANVWTSRWLCGRELSLACYFNVSGPCCADDQSFDRARGSGDPRGAKGAKGAKLSKMVRMGKLKKLKALKGGASGAAPFGKGQRSKRHLSGGAEATVGSSRALTLGGALAEFNVYGSAWVTAQVAHWFWRQMRPNIRAELDARRAAIFPRSAVGRGLTIGMHVRRGDSCALGSRFCPSNKTAAYFERAATLRARYGIHRLVLATDDPEAAALCASKVLGFECVTVGMDRARFQSYTSIERRVVHETSGLLSGAAVSLDALADVDMLADCDAHVLVLRSALSRLVYALSIARKGRFPPLISLQWPWGGLPGPVGNAQLPKRFSMKREI